MAVVDRAEIYNYMVVRSERAKLCTRILERVKNETVRQREKDACRRRPGPGPGLVSASMFLMGFLGMPRGHGLKNLELPSSKVNSLV